MEIQFKYAGKLQTDAELRAFEDRHNLVLPEEYKAFMLQTNGGMPCPQACESVSDLQIGVQQIYSLNDDFPYDLDNACVSTDWEDAYQRGYLQIGHDPGGSGILISTRGPDCGAIYFFEREEALRPPGGAVPIASSFNQFIKSLIPFD